jgi:hypothetical protein
MTDDFNLAKGFVMLKAKFSEMKRINILQHYYVTRNLCGIDLT